MGRSAGWTGAGYVGCLSVRVEVVGKAGAHNAPHSSAARRGKRRGLCKAGRRPGSRQGKQRLLALPNVRQQSRHYASTSPPPPSPSSETRPHRSGSCSERLRCAGMAKRRRRWVRGRGNRRGAVRLHGGADGAGGDKHLGFPRRDGRLPCACAFIAAPAVVARRRQQREAARRGEFATSATAHPPTMRAAGCQHTHATHDRGRPVSGRDAPGVLFFWTEPRSLRAALQGVNPAAKTPIVQPCSPAGVARANSAKQAANAQAAFIVVFGLRLSELPA